MSGGGEVWTHDLKTWPVFFQAVWDGRKAFEVRRDDRCYGPGDVLRLREWDPDTKTYTGRVVEARVTYLLRGPTLGLITGWVIMTIRPLSFTGATDG